jgi:hypothetical protein
MLACYGMAVVLSYASSTFGDSTDLHYLVSQQTMTANIILRITLNDFRSNQISLTILNVDKMVKVKLSLSLSIIL